jgi:hypothetical protein
MTMTLFMDLIELGMDLSLLVTTVLDSFNDLSYEVLSSTMVAMPFILSPRVMASRLYSNKAAHRRQATKY